MSRLLTIGRTSPGHERVDRGRAAAYRADGFVIRQSVRSFLDGCVNRALDIAERELLAAARLMEEAYAMDGRPFVDMATDLAI